MDDFSSKKQNRTEWNRTKQNEMNQDIFNLKMDRVKIREILLHGFPLILSRHSHQNTNTVHVVIR